MNISTAESLEDLIGSVCKTIHALTGALTHDDLLICIDELLESSDDTWFHLLFEKNIESVDENICHRSGNDCYYDNPYKRCRMLDFYKIPKTDYVLCDVCLSNKFWDGDMHDRLDFLKERIMTHLTLKQWFWDN